MANASALAPFSAFDAGNGKILSPCLAIPRNPALARASMAAAAALSSTMVNVMAPESLSALPLLTPSIPFNLVWAMLTHWSQQM